nr:hypothetical protein [Sulfurimonas sp. MAG313]
MTISKLSVSYFNTKILNNIDFTLRHHLCILGSNGYEVKAL